MKVFASIDPGESSKVALASIYSDNPFCSVPYSRVMQNSGLELVLLGVADSAGRIIEGCYGGASYGKLVNTLEITSLPQLSDADYFFSELEKVCRRKRFSQLLVNTFGSIHGARIPNIGRVQKRADRFEYYVDLTREDVLGGLSSNHKRNMKKGSKASLEIRNSASPEDIDRHLQLMGASTQRRTGSTLAKGAEPSGARYREYLNSGAGSLYQAWRGQEVVSSILVLHSNDGAYYHSAGTNSDGMKIGASVFMVVEIVKRLQGQGLRVFNLGGVRAGQDGLRRFKKGFGSVEVALESVQSFMGSRFRQGLLSIKRAAGYR